jgi:lipopolysaccharide transport system ATP-binding protein
MTGRENVYMNGSIMGMRKAEITRKLDEIVDFAGVEKYIDTPVKRFSSGMTVRLGFAIAAYLEPEILVVDEVLAVGDAEFQKKAIGRMQDVSNNEGRTVLFVSHNMQAITNLCSRVILLNKGTVVQNGNTVEVIRNYLSYETSKDGVVYWDDKTALGDSMIKLKAIKIMSEDNHIRNHFFSKAKIKVQIEFILNELDDELVVGFDLTNDDGIVILRTYQNDSHPESWPKFTLGYNSIFCEIPGELLNAGTYYISPKISLHYRKWIVNADPLLSFEVDVNHGLSPFWNRINKSSRPGS